VTSPRENPKPKSNNFFLIVTTRLAECVDGLNSSLAIAVGEFWPKMCQPIRRPARSLKAC